MIAAYGRLRDGIRDADLLHVEPHQLFYHQSSVVLLSGTLYTAGKATKVPQSKQARTWRNLNVAGMSQQFAKIQKHEKALVLDEELDIKVPGAINTYLREYQREGVKFMYRQYKEDRGGLLGDDMGLVSHLLRFGSNRAHQLFLSSFRV